MCYEIAGIDNEINDNGYAADSTEYRDRLDECNTYLRKIQAKGGNVKRVVNQNEYVWQNGMADFN
jgi:hypothetical protein